LLIVWAIFVVVSITVFAYEIKHAPLIDDSDDGDKKNAPQKE